MNWSADSSSITADSVLWTADGEEVLSNATLWQYESLLVNANLIVSPSTNWQTSASVPYGQVISVTPTSGTTSNEWTYVTVVASLGAPSTQATATVPNVVGLQSYQAYQAVNAACLIINTNVYAYSGVVAQGYVISQSLTAGNTVARGTTMQLTISLGAQPATQTTTVP